MKIDFGTKDDWIALAQDAWAAFKTMLPIAAALLAAALTIQKCNAQTGFGIEGNSATMVSMHDGRTAQSFGASVTYAIGYYFAMAIDADAAIGTTGYKTYIDETNLVASLRTDIRALLGIERMPYTELRTGFGWGHTVGPIPTDHNYHTYMIGASVASGYIMPRTRIYISPIAGWRTYGAHIGMRRQYGWIRLEAGIRYEL